MELEVSPETAAAHEAGHAVVALACGIPVGWVEVRATNPSLRIRRYGWTEALEDNWMASEPLPQEAKILRRVALKAGGIAGEHLAGVYDPVKTPRWAMDDVGQIGAGLRDLRLIENDAVATPQPLLTVAVRRALDVLIQNHMTFEELRGKLLAVGRVDSPSMISSWTDADDRQFMQDLMAAKA
ncbi:hypothetical protein HUW63_36445 [Myxococcus sp. AM001]|nr:hypothetical protein [Myxococcus sp. AM001]